MIKKFRVAKGFCHNYGPTGLKAEKKEFYLLLETGVYIVHFDHPPTPFFKFIFFPANKFTPGGGS